MTGWPRTIWTEARQIGALLGWPPAPGDGDAPDRFFEALRAEAHDRDAARFLGQALPRYETVLWAARTVERCSSQADPRVMAAVSAWLADPSETHRRAAYHAARAAPDPSAARLCGLAVFTSGGSLAPEGKPPYPAPKGAVGRFAAGAVLIAVADTPSRATALHQALDYGSRLAAGAPEGQP
ncbi:DUF6931 family protein [Sphingomonas sp. PR090111-T3T-6A]|uniref:DUF6931 family protein n=1 Tax=Sphingomonas sp. PR090111-T3T-6A TaxID=685778 RepID=UPI00035DD294|nr:hypothetical protein [Sphingomonas sp. PR090111-T3T-6A]